MSTKRVSLELSKKLQEKLRLVEASQPSFYPRFEKIISGLVAQEDPDLSAETLSKLAAKKKYTLDKLSKALYLSRLANVHAELQTLFNEVTDNASLDDKFKKSNYRFQLFDSFKRKSNSWPALPPTVEDSREYLPAPHLRK